MKPLIRWTRLAAALVAVIAVALSATATAGAATPADTTSYTSDRYLEHALGLNGKSKYLIESVTYDRFQWLLKQPGKFAFLIGDPASDASFPARAQAVEAAATEAGVKRVFWFNPNLSGSAKIGPITQPNLDIRKPLGITSIAAASARTLNTAWLNVVGRHLGNGVRAEFGSTASNNGEYQSASRVTATSDATVVNDSGATNGYSTKVGNVNGGALFDYTGVDIAAGAAPATITSSSFFFFYDKDNVVTIGADAKPAKILSWVNLTTSATPEADIATAIANCGATNIADPSEFAWWKASNNAKQTTQSPNDYQGSGIPNLTDADGSEARGGWRVHQITYPELVHLLSVEDAKDVVLLFGGTWCPNTRPVLPAINRDAQERDVTVFNFDTILDGSVVGGGNSGSNPLQSRNAAASGSPAVANANPSFVYGELVARFLKNLKTEYTADAANKITYYPAGDGAQPLTSQPRLQVPYLFSYKGAAGDAPHGGITRQWIHTKPNDAGYTEYMSVWHFTNPQPNQLGVTPANLPRELPIWNDINTALASFTYQTDVAALKAAQSNTGTYADTSKYLLATDKANVTYVPPVAPATTGSVTVTSSTTGTVDIGPSQLSAALTGLGASAPTTYTLARSAYVTEYEKAPADQDATKLANLKTVAGAWGVVESRKNRVNSIWGDAGSPSSVAGGAAALRAAQVLFASLPDRTVAPNPGGQNPAPVITPPAVVPPALVPAPTPPATTTPNRTTTTAKVKVTKLVGAATKVPTSKKGGRYTVTFTVPKGKATPTGKITLKLKKGSKTTTLTGALKKGTVTIALPKLAKGTYKVTVSWPGDTTYRSTTASGTLKVKR